MATLAGMKYDVQRSKGLGENDPDMMWLTTMNPETRRLIKVMPEEVECTAQVFDLLPGGRPPGPEEPHRRPRVRLSGAGGHFVKGVTVHVPSCSSHSWLSWQAQVSGSCWGGRG